jgi:hypothetical protein
VLRCRLSKKEASVAIQFDDSDVVVFCFVNNKSFSFIPQEVNGMVGVWGCHGECTFRQMTVHRPGTLPFLVRGPEVKGQK